MLKGKTLIELAQELQNQQETKKDFLVDSPALRVEPEVVLCENGKEIWNQKLILGKNGASEVMGINELGHKQLSSRLGIPRAYYQRLREGYPQLLANNINEIAHNEPQKLLVRSLKQNARAFLSDRYRTIDNYDLMNAILPVLTDASQIGTELVVDSCEVTEKRMYIKILFPKVQGEIKVNDPVQAGLVISNSEVGDGSLKVERLLYILRCKNGMILPASLRKYHAGRRQEFAELDSAVEVYSDRTKQLDDMALFSKVADVVKAAFNLEEFQRQIEEFQHTTKNLVTVPPIEFIEVTAKKFGLAENEKTNTLKHFLQFGDLSQYGLCNAITSTAQEPDTDYDRSVSLERLGSQVLNLSRTEWSVLATV